MTDSEIISMLREFLWAGIWISAPMLITALVVGVVVGLFQALTSVQEMTLTFVPKLVAMLAAFTLCANFSARTMLALFDRSLIQIVGG